MVRVENDKAILEVGTKGAEITSFKMKDTEIEYMWQGNSEFWAGRNPILFPMVSNTWNKKQIINGKEYFMGNHGLARSAEFEVENVTEYTITMVLKQNEETLKLYPFDFTLRVIYTLCDTKVHIRYQIENHSKETMPFSFGLHPAFNCPLTEGEKFEDYHLEFSNEEVLNGLLGPFSLNNDKKIPCDYSLFESNPTICFEYPQSSSVKLTNGKHGVIVDLVGYRWLAFWTKQNAPFMCIEPWHGHGDYSENDLPFDKREGTINLAPNHHYETAYCIEIY
ncbi:aldose 1-epimerase family protein [Anaerorhabdus furcosa]|uniref:Galactose mutarotase n=1 Tax=Anaerorhabdus furcosa TaxID=118967 RepID=A0A1T4LXU8_9FIRM|nr:aldose 1-epimerase family protein [Anaerorhabdus furcosa]SJZ59461.1 Galactose mutarotase [Anaerorhabdus furcosa]